jgi:hypothetical protein
MKKKSHTSTTLSNQMRHISQRFRINSALTINSNLINTIHNIQNNETLNFLSAINFIISTMLINLINLNHKVSQTQSSWRSRSLSFRSSIQNNKASSLSSRNHTHNVSIRAIIAKNTIKENHWEEHQIIKLETIIIIEVKLKKLTLTRLRRI